MVPFELYVSKTVAALLLPPANGWLLVAIGLILLRAGHRRSGRFLFGLGLISSFAFTLVPVSNLLLKPLEQREAPLDFAAARASGAQAIVILGGGKNRVSVEYPDSETMNRHSAQRTRYGARVAHALGLPILVSGGKPTGDLHAESTLMAQSLIHDYGLRPRWIEDRSLTTAENAAYTRRILAPEGKTTIVLVTDALHMRRARWMFEQEGFRVISAPTGYEHRKSIGWVEWFPSADGLRFSYLACHEWLGLMFYQLRAWWQRG